MDQDNPIIKTIQARHSTRAFTGQDVTDAQVRSILAAASWSPSGVNTQPWQVAVVRNETKQTTTDRLIQARQDGLEPDPDYAYYPDEWDEPYNSRRVDCGKTLYQALGIQRKDKDAKMQAWFNNYRFFGAPVGLLFFVDKRMNKGSWVDMGMFIQSVMIAAQGIGLSTCPQASLAEYPSLVREILSVEPGMALICGMSLGYADEHHPVNQYRLARTPVDDFTTWYD